MKTPPDPFDKDLVAAMGNPSRRKRDDDRRIARAETTCVSSHTQSECSGTETLASIERALSRLASGTYGICVTCGDDISLARLERNPAVETCAKCTSQVVFKAC
ncbi:MAG: TraR/DksA C4-type zinc finger protein [Pseudomonadota bacterium]